MKRPEGTCEGEVRDTAGQSSHAGVGGISFSASGSHGLQGDFFMPDSHGPHECFGPAV